MSVLPWWAAGAGLAGVAVGHWLADRRPLGVSGVLARFANLRSELAAEREAARAPSGEEALAAALAAATAEALAAGELTTPSTAGSPTTVSSLGPPASLAGHAAFLVALCAGGFLARLAGSRLDPMGAAAGRAGAAAVLILAVGGLLLGLGAGWMGGCTTGHGITGCSRLMPGSLVATGVFVATAVIATSLLRGALPG